MGRVAHRADTILAGARIEHPPREEPAHDVELFRAHNALVVGERLVDELRDLGALLFR